MKIRRRDAFLFWLIGSLAAIALIGDLPYIGLAVALGSGVAFGVLNWFATRPAPTELEKTGVDLRRNIK